MWNVQFSTFNISLENVCRKFENYFYENLYHEVKYIQHREIGPQDILQFQYSEETISPKNP